MGRHPLCVLCSAPAAYWSDKGTAFCQKCSIEAKARNVRLFPVPKPEPPKEKKA